ncbi:MAG: tol-pal system-associated acyl-CoA thioesterase [Solirubrobacterales bacterium]
MSVFRYPVRVYYEDTDAGGIVYHSNYLKFAERARTELVRSIGVNQAELMDGGKGYAFAVHRVVADFVRPARLDDQLEVETRLLGVGGASADFEQVIRREGAELVRLDVRVAFIGLDGRPARIPPYLRVSLRELVSERR